MAKKIKFFNNNFLFALVLLIFPVAFQSLTPLTVLIYLDVDEAFQKIQNNIAEKVNVIIQEELAKVIKKQKSSYELPVFKVQEHLHVTLLFDRMVDEKFEQSSFLALQLMQSLGRGFLKSNDAQLTSDGDLFGFHQEFIVAKVQDTSSSLLFLRNDIKSSLRLLDRYAGGVDDEKQGVFGYFDRLTAWVKSFFVPAPTQKHIFNTESWDKYSFNPHVTFGKMPRQEIFKVASWNRCDGKQLWENIKKRVHLDVIPYIKEAAYERPLKCKSFYVHGKSRGTLGRFSCERPVNNDNAPAMAKFI